MNPDWENFRKQDMYRSCPSLSRQRRAEQYGWVPFLIVAFFIVAFIFGW